MVQSIQLIEAVRDRLRDFITDRASILAPIGPDVAALADYSRDFLSAGKRFRAQFCYWGAKGVQSHGEQEASRPGFRRSIVTIASALELFHAAALIHDDIIDSSDTRRGRSSAHRHFESLHRSSGWSSDAENFGRTAAILLGDLLLGWSDELLDEGIASLGDRDAASAARGEFNRMRTEVTAGQYLDAVEENAWSIRDESALLPAAERVILYKSAKYSVASPLAIGALAAGGSVGQLATLRDFGFPLGVAFQLRDDILGVFGDPDRTGKPSGDDLREGKRTVLVALARQKLPGTPRRILDELLGDRGLDGQQIAMLQRTIIDSGACDAVEGMIAQNVRRAHAALDEASLDEAATLQLRELADTVTARTA